MENFKSGFVSLVGKTNVGKSTLLNAMLNENLAITTSKPQTTRKIIKGIVNRPNSQIIFKDTPGIHKPKNKFGEFMIQEATEAMGDVDVILFLVNALDSEIGKSEQLILEKLEKQNKKVILVINKIDIAKKENILNLINQYKDLYNFASSVPVSAL